MENNSQAVNSIAVELNKAASMETAGFSECADKLLTVVWKNEYQIHQMGEMDSKSRVFKNTAVKDKQSATQFAKTKSAAGVDVYLACAGYANESSRTAANATGAYGFWMDIDCGEQKAQAGKGYLTVEAALSALDKFCDDAGLPKSTHIILSGGGIQAYWTVTNHIERDLWQVVAAKLKALTQAQGLLADPSRTADIASVMRMPGTLNYKYTPPRPVVVHYAADTCIETSEMLSAIEAAHQKLCFVPVQALTPAREVEVTSNQSGDETPPPDLEFMASVLRVLPPDCDEKTWKFYRLAPLAREARLHSHLKDALRELARAWSSGELCGIPSKAWHTVGRGGWTGRQWFDYEWKRFTKPSTYQGRETTIGTIIADAKDAGWTYDGYRASDNGGEV